jgi:hypothetical protein
MSVLPPKADLAELHGALIFINAEATLLGRLKAACRPTRVDCLHRVPDNHLLDMLALRTFERQKVGMGRTRFDPGQHHPALTLRAAWPWDGKQGWGGMTIGFGRDASPALGGSGTLSVTGRRRYGTVMGPACSSGSRSRWSLLLTFQKNVCITPESRHRSATLPIDRQRRDPEREA